MVLPIDLTKILYKTAIFNLYTNINFIYKFHKIHALESCFE